MQRSKGGMASPIHVTLLFALFASCSAGPLGPLPNVTSVDLGLKEGSCALGDVVYMPGDEFPGASPCERCSCSDGSVQCSKQRCEPRPGCKAVHRPDHCCPTYQCECEQEGRVYDNGEKLVDPQDPCKVCYCQGGEVVCRRIACFVRDDCTPRLVPGRCCPEYDNCPLRGVTTLPGVSPAIPSTAAVENIESSAPPSPPKENIKQEITIKEITPVSEIPVITDVKIKEILPSPTMEVAEYSSSKSPLITREATTEKTIYESSAKTEAPAAVDTSSLSPSPELPPSSSNNLGETKSSNDPSKISLSTQDSINSEMYPPNIITIASMGSPSISPDVAPVVLTTKAPVIEEEDLSPIDHNPLFPPIPDDLTVSNNHEDEIVQQEQNSYSEHGSDAHEVVSASSPPTSTEAAVKELLTTTIHYLTDSVPLTSQDISTELSTSKENVYTTELSEKTSSRQNAMINLRSAIPTEILNVPSLVTEDVTEESEVSTDIPITEIGVVDSSPEIIIGTENTDTREESNIVSDLNVEKDFITSTETDIPYSDATYKPEEDIDHVTSSQETQDQTTNYISKSNIATEITSQTELSSIPIETSDQKPHDTSEKILKDKTSTLTTDSAELDFSTTKLLPVSSEIITVSRGVPENDDQSFENVETTEFILTSFGSSESATEPVELIKISSDTEKSSAIIDSKERNNNVLTDLINLVGDVASISDHTESAEIEHPTTGRTTISDSEELLPVNVGYKSKNNNRNQNSITEVPYKSKASGNKQRVVEIEDDDFDNITDSPPPHDKVEPTTRRPIIDNVSDDGSGNKTEKYGKKDIEIITQSYVPTINRRPTKVVMKKNNEKPISEEVASESAASSEVSTANNVQSSSETTVAPVLTGSSSEAEERIVDETENTTTPEQ